MAGAIAGISLTLRKSILKTSGYTPPFSVSFHNRVPMGQRGCPTDLVGAAVFLAAPVSDYLVGQTIIADGGFLIA
jgi:NAD(P)-dependent dehydrogenase (short-subunit alcohol dehydrogenase family)